MWDSNRSGEGRVASEQETGFTTRDPWLMKYSVSDSKLRLFVFIDELYLLHNKNGNVYSLADKNGNVYSLADKNGNIYSLADKNGNVYSLADKNGNVYSLSDKNGNVSLADKHLPLLYEVLRV